MTVLFNTTIFFATIIYWLLAFFWFIKKQSYTKRALIMLIILGSFLILCTVGNSIYVNYQSAYKSSDQLTKYISQYVFETRTDRLLTHWLASIGFALVMTLLFVWLWRAKRGLVVDGADVTLLALGMVMAQWPNMLILLLMIFALVVVIQIVLVALKKRTINDRLIITPAIPLAVIITILFGGYLAAVSGLAVIRF